MCDTGMQFYLIRADLTSFSVNFSFSALIRRRRATRQRTAQMELTNQVNLLSL